MVFRKYDFLKKFLFANMISYKYDFLSFLDLLILLKVGLCLVTASMFIYSHRFSMKFTGSKVWNSIPSNIKQAPKLHPLKKYCTTTY